MTPLALSWLGIAGILWAVLLVLILIPLLLYGERRHEQEGRRKGPVDRRRALPDTREVKVERRSGPPDRRTGVDRRTQAGKPQRGIRRWLTRFPRRPR